MLSLVAIGIAPGSCYELDANGNRQRAHYDGLPVDFIAEAIATLGAGVENGYQTYHVLNPYDDGIGFDQYVDWLNETGYPIQRIADYNDWLQRFETAMRALPQRQRQHSVLPLLHYYRRPEKPLRGALASTERFHAAVLPPRHRASTTGLHSGSWRLPPSVSNSSSWRSADGLRHRQNQRTWRSVDLQDGHAAVTNRWLSAAIVPPPTPSFDSARDRDELVEPVGALVVQVLCPPRESRRQSAEADRRADHRTRHGGDCIHVTADGHCNAQHFLGIGGCPRVGE
jgi:hypothetical protein